jgi:hypothetical protein
MDRLRRESDAHFALTDTAKLRSLDVLHGEIARELRRKAGTIGERRPVFPECPQCGRRRNGNCECPS